MHPLIIDCQQVATAKTIVPHLGSFFKISPRVTTSSEFIMSNRSVRRVSFTPLSDNRMSEFSQLDSSVGCSSY